MQVPSDTVNRPTAHDWNPPASDRGMNVIPGVASGDSDRSHFLGELYRNTPPIDSQPPSAVVRVDVATGEILAEEPSAPVTPKGYEDIRLIGRFDDLYLLFQVEHELYILDQHTAHERVLFEETMRMMDAHGSVGQHLLLTVQLELGAEQMVLFEEAREILLQAGFAVDLFGGNSVRIEAVPAILARRSPEKAFRSVLDDVASLKKSGYDLKKAVAQSVACRSAVMSGDRLSDREAVGLVERLLKCENRYSCPHGRPTFIRLSREYLDKQFGRA